MVTETMTKSKILVNHIIFVLDKSGSMGHLRKVTVDNFNEQLGQLKIDAKKNQVNLVSFITFNSKVQRVREDVPLGNFEEITMEEYEPQGWTALYDAIGDAIMIADRGFEKYADMDNSALIVVLSDGMENHSKEYDRNKMATIVKEKQDGGRFTFSFLGCGDHVVKQAVGIGIPIGNTEKWEYTNEGIVGAVALNSCATKSYMSARNAGHIATSGFYDTPFEEQGTGVIQTQ